MEVEDAAVAFGALAGRTRLDLLRLLTGGPPAGLAAGAIAARLGAPASTLSFHLRSLEQAGLIAATRRGRCLIYRASEARLGLLARFLAETCGLASTPNPRQARAMTTDPFHVLFLCTRNSARSIMAEAILGKVAPGRFVAHSAGSEPAAEGPMPEVLAQLKALGHDVSGLRSKSWTAFTGPDAPSMDFVITLCDTLAGQACPDFGQTTATAAWPLPDPAKFTGSTAERATLLNELYAGLRRRIEIFVALPVRSLDAIALKARIDELADPHALAR